MWSNFNSILSVLKHQRKAGDANNIAIHVNKQKQKIPTMIYASVVLATLLNSGFPKKKFHGVIVNEVNVLK